MAGIVEALQHRRFLKSHLALDGLPYRESTKYVYVGRDTRDVFMSTWNHVRAYTPLAREMLNSGENAPAEPFLEPPEDIREFWHLWITRATYPWESDGFPYWSHHHHARSYWDHRHLPNILFVHYNDLKADLEGEMRRIARFLEIEVPEEKWPTLSEAATFAAMKRDAELLGPEMNMIFEGGADRFLYKVTLHQAWTFEDMIPAPKKPQKLPIVLSPEEVLQFLGCVHSLRGCLRSSYRCQAIQH